MNWGEGTLSGKLQVEPVELSRPPGSLLGSLAAHEDPVMLDSSALHETYGRYSVLGCHPIEVLTLLDGVLSTRSGEILARGDDDAIWTRLRDAFAKVRVPPTTAPPYCPGWIGYVGYEVGRHIERLPGKAARDTDLPDLRVGLYDCLLVYDAVDRKWEMVQLIFDKPVPCGAGVAAEVLREIATGSQSYSPEPPPEPIERADAAAKPTITNAQSNFTPQEYQQAVARCVEYIAAGDIFQVNLSQRFTVPDPPEPLRIYRTLRRRNPSWYAAFLRFESRGKPCAILSSSPELFLRLRGDHVITRPIKGTRPRIGEQQADAVAAANLLASPKDNAELAMIIDLLRNDLGRVCGYGTVRVTDPRRLETHPTVFHLVGTVEGRLREGVGPAELLRATFPGGSITGAPKIRSIEIIDELEGVARGVYTGCIGIVGVDGSCEWNIAIRTIVCDSRGAYVQVGGGIVADSDPLAEYNETLDKARAMFEAIAEATTKRPTHV